MLEGDGSRGSGFIICDCLGHGLRGSSFAMRVVSVPMAELIGVLEVIWLEGDALEVLLKEHNFFLSEPALF